MTSTTASEKKNVLIVVSIMGQFPEMYRIACLLKKSNTYNPIMYFNLGVYARHPNIVKCLNTRIDVLDYMLGFLKKEEESNSFNSLTKLPQHFSNSFNYHLKQFIKQKLPILFNILKEGHYYFFRTFQALEFFNLLIQQLRRNKKETNYLKQFDIKLMVFAEDNIGYYTPSLIKNGHKSGIKSIVFPYTFANQYEFLEEAYFFKRFVNKKIINRIVAKIFPKWVYLYKNKKILRTDSSRVILCELFGIAPQNPWVMNGGNADIIAIESQFMKEYYAKAGIPKDQMIETGFPSLDRLNDVYTNKNRFKNDFSVKYKLDIKKPWVLFSVPPSQWPRPGVGFNSYDDFLVKIFNFCKTYQNVEFLFKFHPREAESEIERYSKRFNIKNISEDTVDLVGVCDMYIASVSSTIRWALALGIPTINYDVYNFNYGDFEGAKNYHTVVRFEEFSEKFNKIYKDISLFFSNQNTDSSEYYAKLDGQSEKRIKDLFDDFTLIHNGR